MVKVLRHCCVWKCASNLHRHQQLGSHNSRLHSNDSIHVNWRRLSHPLSPHKVHSMDIRDTQIIFLLKTMLPPMTQPVISHPWRTSSGLMLSALVLSESPSACSTCSNKQVYNHIAPIFLHYDCWQYVPLKCTGMQAASRQTWSP